jgi:hypothetical protein
MPLVHLVKIGLTLAAKYLMDPHFGRFDDSIEIDKNPSEPPDPGSTHGAPTDGHEGGQSDVIYSLREEDVAQAAQGQAAPVWG